jgi:hypothetical protein
MTRQSKETHQLEMILRRARYRRMQTAFLQYMPKDYVGFTSSKNYTKLCNDERREGLRV